MNDNKSTTDCEEYATHLYEYTPLSEQQAQVLARRKAGLTTKEISDELVEETEAVKDVWEGVLEQWNHAQNLCGIMGPHPWGDGEYRKKNEFDDSPWVLVSSAAMSYCDEERTRTELELYYWGTIPGTNRFLLVEREILDTADFSTKTTEHRSIHTKSGLHNYLYSDLDTLDECYLRVALLHKGGIDPNSEHAPLISTVLGRDLTNTEKDEAFERAMSKVNRIR